MKTIRAATAALFVASSLLATGQASAASFKKWENFKFFGATRAQVLKALGKPDDTDGMDSYIIADSPDLMMMGLVGYENGKVAAVTAVLQPKVTYQRVKDIQSKAEGMKKVSETKKGILFKYTKPAPNGPVYLAISPPDDKSTGPLLIESIENPFADGTEEPPANKPAPDKPRLDLSLLDKDVFDWNMLDDDGKLDLLRKVKKLWRATGAETDANAISAADLLKKIKFPDQSLVVDQACIAAGIDPEPFRKLRANRSK